MNASLAYQTLGLPFGSEESALKSSWRRLVRTHHPDLGGNATAFLQVQEAYEFLTDPRNAYLLKKAAPSSAHQTRASSEVKSEFDEAIRRAEANLWAAEEAFKKATQAKAKAEKNKQKAYTPPPSASYYSAKESYWQKYAYEAYAKAKETEDQAEMLRRLADSLMNMDYEEDDFGYE
jgi:DnaJ-class molecular chaperone